MCILNTIPEDSLYIGKSQNKGVSAIHLDCLINCHHSYSWLHLDATDNWLFSYNTVEYSLYPHITTQQLQVI